MKTLTEVLTNAIKLNVGEVTTVKEVIKAWLKTADLPLVTSVNRRGVSFDATEFIRGQLVTLVDEP